MPLRLGNRSESVDEWLKDLVGSIIFRDLHENDDEGLLGCAAGLEQNEPLITPEAVVTVVASVEPGVGEALNRYRKVPYGVG